MPPPNFGVPEKPSRVLFVRNINYTASDKEVREVFEKYGDVIDVFSRIGSRGMAFVTFSDIRDAEEALHKLQGTVIKDREIDIHYSLPRDANDKFNDRPESQQNDTLFVSVRGCTTPVSNEEIHKVFARYGDIKEIRDCPKSPSQKFVEYYDLRACQSAFKDLQNAVISEGVLDIKFATEKKNANPPASQAQSSRNSRGDHRSRGDSSNNRPSSSSRLEGSPRRRDSQRGSSPSRRYRDHRDSPSSFGGGGRSFGDSRGGRSGFDRGGGGRGDGRDSGSYGDRDSSSAYGNRDSGSYGDRDGGYSRGAPLTRPESQWDQRDPHYDSRSGISERSSGGGYPHGSGSHHQSPRGDDSSSGRYRGSHRMGADPYPTRPPGGRSYGGDPRRPPPPRVEGAMNHLTSVLKEQASYQDQSYSLGGSASRDPYGPPQSQYSPNNMNQSAIPSGGATLGALANLYQATGGGSVAFSPQAGVYQPTGAYPPGQGIPANAQQLLYDAAQLSSIIGQLQQTAYSQGLLSAINPQNPLVQPSALGGDQYSQASYQPTDPSYFTSLSSGGSAVGYTPGMPGLNSGAAIGLPSSSTPGGPNDYGSSLQQQSQQLYSQQQSSQLSRPQSYSQPSQQSSSSTRGDSYNPTSGGSSRYS